MRMTVWNTSKDFWVMPQVMGVGGVSEPHKTNVQLPL